MIADVEKTSLMISAAEKDCDCLRFLWLQDVSKDPPENKVLRFKRVIFGVRSSPYLLNAILRHHLSLFADTHPDLVQKLERSNYVNDIVTGATDEETTYLFYEQSKSIFRDGGFNHRKFVTNSSLVQQLIDANESELSTS